MPLAPAVAASLSAGLPARTKALWINGLDVLREPGSSARYGVEVTSVALTEEGPGGVSSLSFAVDDPTGVLAFAQGARILFYDLTNDAPLFAGFLAQLETVVLGIGRLHVIQADGAESVLDWLTGPAMTIPAGITVDAAVQSIFAAQAGIGVQLQALSIGNVQMIPGATIAGSGDVLTASVDIGAGTLRQQLQDLAPAAVLASSNDISDLVVHVSARWELMVAGRLNNAQGDWLNNYWASSLAILAPTKAPAGTQQSLDLSGTARQVRVIGGNAAGSGVFTDGTGLPGPTVIANDSSSLTAGYAQSLARAILATRGPQYAGAVSAEELFVINVAGPGSAEYHAGMHFALTDTSLGISAAILQIASIDKTFLGNGKERWTIHYGGRTRASAMLRRLTASVVST